MNDPLTDDQVRNLLKSEYPTLFQCEVDRMVKTCRREKWFLELLKRAPRSAGITQGLNPVNVEEAEPDHLEISELEEAKSELAKQRDAQVRGMELLTQLLLDSQVHRVQCMRASIGIALLKGSLDPKEVADHFDVSDETVRVQTRKVEETFRKLE